MSQNRDLYLKRAKVFLARQDERVRAAEARIDESEPADQEKTRQSLLSVLDLKLDSICALKDLRLASEPGWTNAMVTAEQVWSLFDKAIGRLERHIDQTS